MTYSAWLQAADHPEERYDLTEVVYTSRSGALLDVRHDRSALAARDGAGWRQLFDDRWRRRDLPDASGVWSKREWVCPRVTLDNIVSLHEGYSPLFHMPRLGRLFGLSDLWVKACGASHTGSFKDLGMTVLVSVVQQIRAEGGEIRAVACASTGDTSAALACYGAAAGIPTIVFLPRGKVSTAQLVQPLSHGALVLALETDFDGCMEIVRALTADKTIYLANSLNSLRIEGQKTVSIEISQQLGWRVPDWVVIPGGNLGNTAALGRGFDMLYDLGLVDRRPRIAVAQAARANPLYQAYLRGFDRLATVRAGETAATAIRIGAPVSYGRAVDVLRRFDGVVAQATEAELAEAAAMADRHGLYTCPQTGVALAAARTLAREGVIECGQEVVVVSTAHGLKFSEFKVQTHEGRSALGRSDLVNPPVELPADVDAVRRAIDTRLATRTEVA